MNKRKGFKKDISNPDDLIGKRVRITYTGVVSHANKYNIHLRVKKSAKDEYIVLPNVRNRRVSFAKLEVLEDE